MKRKSRIPNVEKNNRKDEENQKVEQEKHKNRFYISALNPENLKQNKYLFEQMEIVKRQVGLIAKEQELLKVRQNELQGIMAEVLDLIEDEEERNLKAPEEIIKQKDKPIEATMEEHKRERLEKTSLFKSPDHKVS